MQIQHGNILKGPFWPEKVRVIAVKPIGESQIKIDAVGLETRAFYNPILSEKDITTIEVIEEKPFQFSGDGESLFLYFESHRLFLTATPHRGDPENFRLLLDLLEPGFFVDTAMLSESIQNKDNPL